MSKNIRYFLAGALCFAIVYGCLWLLGYMLERVFSFGDGRSDIDIASNVKSPNGKHIATVYTDMGGGAVGWCDKKVNVRRAAEPFDPKKGEVFSTYCSSRLELSWEDDGNLKVTYPAREILSLFQRSWSDDGEVNILFIERAADTLPQVRR